MKLHIALVSCSFFLLFNVSAIGGCHDYERAALLDFKSLLTDLSNRLSSWQGWNCCSWHGIRCSESLHVVEVDLRNCKPINLIINMNSEVVSISGSSSTALNGTLSPSLFALTHLHTLDLSFNNFMFSRLPAGIAKLTGLTYLNLSNAMFDDSITNQFANLTSLKWLDLSCSNQVTDLSSISFNLSSSLTVHEGSEYSYISGGHLSSSNMDWLQKLQNLRALRLSGIDLSEASKSTQWANPISVLSNLRLLQLSNCKISGQVPIYQLLNLTHLSVLHMDFNNFISQIPFQLANLSSLSVLDLGISSLQGPIPYLPQLKELYVSNSNLKVDLKSVFAVPWPRLEVLDIGSTHVIGSIPPEIANITSLVNFKASDSLIQGSIPSAMSNLSRLKSLELNFNSLEGRLPPTISNMKSLESLLLVQNLLQGSIPDSICNISSLQVLGLARNNLTGNLPECIGHLPNLDVFFVTYNSLTGTIQSLASFFKNSTPHVIALGLNQLTVNIDQQPFPPNFQLRILEVTSCNIQGSIPDSLSSQTQLEELYFANNSLSGTIPSWLFNLSRLNHLDLSFNSLQGFLPQRIRLRSYFGPAILQLASNLLQGPLPSKLQNMDAIDLSGNNFSGHIPPQLVLGKVRYLSLSGNNLVGQIPFSFCPKNSILMHLDLSNNSLSGAVPSSLGNCVSLKVLNIGQNIFNGRVPGGLENAKALNYLDITGNQFDGPFPSFIENLKNLMVLKMGYNKFSGKIPQFIGDFQNLLIFVLKSNFFSGSIPPEINKLRVLQVLDFSNNTLSGPVPGKLDGLKAMTTRLTDGSTLGYFISFVYVGVELSMTYKGLVYQYDVVRTYNNGIDLSVNDLTGNIPPEIGLLEGLSMLNLSQNHLSGEIPSNIGNMRGLESLDLSFNDLSQGIPISINLLDSLSVMNLSYNNLSGRIPPGTRFDTLYGDGSAYIGNKFLCGAPDGMCSSSNNNTLRQETVDARNDKGRTLFYGVVILGYAVGFWGYFLGVLYLLKKQWREKYWRAIDKIVLRIIKCMQRT